ncbi:helix-turn-helix transcriptional regulator [Terrilactibacillus sp. S3-3]|nr:helix-turn-helix transcriptional regulator [Terrilactibacillus sp. S3-3]
MSDLIKLTHQLNAQIPGGREEMFSLENLMGELIFGYRMRRGLSQEELAKRAGVDKKSVYRVEGGHSRISSETYNKLLKALDVTLETVDAAKEQLEEEKQHYLQGKKKKN